MNRLSFGSNILDQLLEGGYEKDTITTIYGPAGSGKTCLCMLASTQMIAQGKKVIYVDTDGSFSIERFMQLCNDYKQYLEKIIFFKPTCFKEQAKVFEKLKDTIKNNIGLIVVDTIAIHYRLELGKEENNIQVINRELSTQISWLSEIARKNEIPVIITNQVYADFDEKSKVKMVGGDILRYTSKCLIELQITPSSRRRAIIKKHRSIKEEKEAEFKIVNEGIAGIKEKRFRIF